MPTRIDLVRLAVAALVLALLAGCAISKSENGNSEDVRMATPLGGLKVQTNINPQDVGLTLYPGARLKPRVSGHDDTSANVNIATPFFAIKVIAADYLSDDPPQKVLDFYKKDMARYGKVIQCDNASQMVTPQGDGHFTLELKCDQSSGDATELKAGEGDSQHLVSVKPSGTGAEFGLVYIQMHGSKEGNTI